MSEQHNKAVTFPTEKPLLRNEAQIEIVRSILTRLEAGEQFQGVAILLVDKNGYEYPYSGKQHELLTCATMFAHRLLQRLCED